VFVDGGKGRQNVYDKKFQRYAKDNRTTLIIIIIIIIITDLYSAFRSEDTEALATFNCTH